MVTPNTSAARCPWTDNDGERCSWPPHKGNVHRLASVAGQEEDDHDVDVDVDVIERDWTSNFPESDPRQTILTLVGEVRRLRESEAELLESERDLMTELEAQDA